MGDGSGKGKIGEDFEGNLLSFFRPSTLTQPGPTGMHWTGFQGTSTGAMSRKKWLARCSSQLLSLRSAITICSRMDTPSV
jgi:hypothetical protein